MRPILVGMNNPVSTRSGHELYPLPEGCTGNRLWRMLNARTGATMRQYTEAFERRNLVIGREWDRLAARARAYEIVVELRDSGRTVVLLGNAVREAFDWVLKNDNTTLSLFAQRIESSGVLTHVVGSLPPVLVHPQVIGGCTWRQIPHPSGRNLYYNDEKNRRVVELLMEELYVEYRKREKVA